MPPPPPPACHPLPASASLRPFFCLCGNADKALQRSATKNESEWLHRHSQGKKYPMPAATVCRQSGSAKVGKITGHLGHLALSQTRGSKMTGHLGNLGVMTKHGCGVLGTLGDLDVRVVHR